MKKLLFCLLICCNLSYANVPMVTQVIPLQTLQGQALANKLTPFLNPGESVSGSGKSLIVHASALTLSKLKMVIHQLDVPPMVLQVSIHQGSADWANNATTNSVSYTASSQVNAGDSQTVSVNNGQSAFVSTGGNRPVVSSVSGGFYPGVSYQRDETQEGFYVTPILTGDKVEVKIKRVRQRQDQANQDQDQDQNIDTTMMVSLDKWTMVGSASDAENGSNDNSVSYDAGDSYSDTSSLFIKVTKAN